VFHHANTRSEAWWIKNLCVSHSVDHHASHIGPYIYMMIYKMTYWVIHYTQMIKCIYIYDCIHWMYLNLRLCMLYVSIYTIIYITHCVYPPANMWCVMITKCFQIRDPYWIHIWLYIQCNIQLFIMFIWLHRSYSIDMQTIRMICIYHISM